MRGSEKEREREREKDSERDRKREREREREREKKREREREREGDCERLRHKILIDGCTGRQKDTDKDRQELNKSVYLIF